MTTRSTNIASFPPSETLQPEQALDYVRGLNAQEVLICGYGPDGEFFTISSQMSARDALWLAEQLRLHVLDL